MQTKEGALGVEIGKLAVRRSIFINAPPERVWREFEDFDRMKAWWGTGHSLITYEPRVGGRIEMEVDRDGKPTRFGGAIVVFDEARELTFEDDWMPNQGWEAPTYITLRLTPELGGTLVELFHHSFERTGDGAADDHAGYEGGWSMRQLEALREIVEA